MVRPRGLWYLIETASIHIRAGLRAGVRVPPRRALHGLPHTSTEGLVVHPRGLWYLIETASIHIRAGLRAWVLSLITWVVVLFASDSTPALWDIFIGTPPAGV